MKLTNKIDNFFEKRQHLLYLLLFLIAASLFGYLQLDPTFADPDSFYHAKMAEILASQGAITEFPWLSATTLEYNFVDHHFLYHLVLIPFVALFPPLVGLKIATVIFAALAVLAVFWLLRHLEVKGAFWYVLFLLTINPFIFRLNLAKAQPLVLVLFFIAIYLLLTRRYLGLALVSGLYVWLYGGWPVVLLLAVVYGAVNWFWLYRQKGWLRTRMNKAKIFRQNFSLLVGVGSGILAGLFFNPYFPGNFQFYWQQSFKIALVNYQNLIGVGGEWYPYSWPSLMAAAVPFFLLFILALAVFIIYFKKQSMNSWFFLVLTFLFFALTLKSRRYVEYFIPLAICFSAVSLGGFWGGVKSKLATMAPKQTVSLFPVIILLVLSPVFFNDLQSIKRSYQNGFSFDKFAAASQWLKDNSSAGDIVFHSDWDEFPVLFYHNDKDYYLVGLDPTFMYEYDRSLYNYWADITIGKLTDNLYPIIKDIFGARYVLIDVNQNVLFDRNLASNFYFEKVFEDKEARIYRVAE